MRFEYLISRVVGDTLEVEDVGNCCIKAFNDLGEEWVIIIQTSLGDTEIFEFGAFIPDIIELPKSCAFTYKRIQYKESKIQDAIDKFLNDPYRHITQAFEITKEEAKSLLRNLEEYVE